MKKSVISVLLAFCLLLGCLAGIPVEAADSAVPAGNGTAESPYLVSCAAELFWIAANANMKAIIRLTADIDLDDAEWTPIGASAPFAGSFDGGGFTVSGFKVTAAERAGLFSALRGATVRNLTIDRAELVTVSASTGFGGALAGVAEGSTVRNVTIGKNVTVKGYNVGGVIGRTQGDVSSLTFCVSAATVQTDGTIAGEAAGGIVGLCGAANLDDCINQGSVTAVGSGEQLAGGIAGRFGYVTAGQMTNCLNSGTVQSSHTAGGVVGKSMLAGCGYENCVSTGSVAEGLADWSGVLIGRFAAAGTVRNSFVLASGDYGLIGKNAANAANSTLENALICTTDTDREKLDALIAAVEKHFADRAQEDEAEQKDQDLTYPEPDGVELLDTWDGSLADGFASGTGSHSDPFVIATGAQLARLSAEVNSGSFSGEGYWFVLGGSLNLGGNAFLPIGTKEHPFKGTFNGKGYTVCNFTAVSSVDNAMLGLFGVTEGAVLKNLRVDFAALKADCVNCTVGGIVGIANGGSVIACTVGEHVKLTGIGSGNDIYVGGIVGKLVGAGSELRACINRAAVRVSGTQSTVGAGGIVALTGGATIADCVNFGTVTAGSVSSANIIAGGIIGNMGASKLPAVLRDCVNLGDVSSPHTAGGLVGRLNIAENEVSDCLTCGAVSGNADYTGFGIGRTYASPKTLSGCKYLAGNGFGAIGLKNEGLVMSEDAAGIEGLLPEVYANTLNPMEADMLKKTADVRIAAIERLIAESVAKDEEPPLPPDTGSSESPTEETPTGETPTGETPSDTGTGEPTGDAAKPTAGCASSITALAALLPTVLCGAATALRRRKTGGDE